jgi:hypothetical protein
MSERTSASSRGCSTTPSQDRWTPLSSPRPSTTHEGAVASESDTTSSPIFTPASSSVFTFSGSPRGDSPHRLPGIPESDIPIPSVESGEGPSQAASCSPRSQNPPSVSSSRPLSARSPTPSITISQAPVSSAAATPRSSSVGFSEIDAGIRGIQLSQPGDSLDMSGLAAALPQSFTSDSRPASLRASTAQSESPRPSSGRPRRSSSRVNLLPHNVRDEQPPQDRFHEPAFQQAFRDSKALMGGLAEVLGSNTLHLEPDSTMKSLRQTAQDLATFQCPPTRVVGLVGDSGVGMHLRFGNQSPSWTGVDNTQARAVC